MDHVNIITIGNPITQTKWNFEAPEVLPDPEFELSAPFEHCNWLIPERLILGEKPGGAWTSSRATIRDDVDILMKYNITMFVCLLGEFGSVDQFKTHYPAILKEKGFNGYVVYLPIYDFDSPSAEDLVQVVRIMKESLASGERIYLHCRGGHGRSGMAAIPLLVDLYQKDYDEIENYLQQLVQFGRKADGGYAHEMPETREQANIAKKTIQLLRNNV